MRASPRIDSSGHWHCCALAEYKAASSTSSVAASAGIAPNSSTKEVRLDRFVCKRLLRVLQAPVECTTWSEKLVQPSCHVRLRLLVHDASWDK